MENLLTIKQMAAHLGLSWRGLQEHTKRRTIPHIKLGRSVRYRASDVEKALVKLTVKSI